MPYSTISQIQEINNCYNSNTPIVPKCDWPSLAPDNQLLALNADVNNPLHYVKENYAASMAPVLKVSKSGMSEYTVNIENLTQTLSYSSASVSGKCADLTYVAAGPVQVKCPKKGPCVYSKTVYSVGFTTPVGGYSYIVNFPADLGNYLTIVIGIYATSDCPLPVKAKPAVFKLFAGGKNFSIFNIFTDDVSKLKTIKLKKKGNYYVVA